MLTKFDADTFLETNAKEGMTGPQILGLLLANAEKHYQEEHKAVLRKFYAIYDNPIEVKQMLNKELGGQNAETSKGTDSSQLRLV